MTSPASGANGAPDLPDYAPIPRSALGPALNDQGYYVGRVERNLYWVTDGTYQSAFLTTPTGWSAYAAMPDGAAVEPDPLRPARSARCSGGRKPRSALDSRLLLCPGSPSDGLRH